MTNTHITKQYVNVTDNARARNILDNNAKKLKIYLNNEAKDRSISK